MAQMPEAIILRKTEETKTGVTYCMADVKTNADRIRSMSDEELVDFILEVGGNIRAGLTPDGGWLNWLEQEAE